MRETIILLCTVAILAPVFRICFGIIYAFFAVGRIIYAGWQKYRGRKKKLNRIIGKIEAALKKDIAKLVRGGRDACSRHVLEVQNELSKLDFENWVSMEYQVANSNVWRIGLFHSFYSPPDEIEQLQVVKGIKDILWWQILRDLPQTRNPARLLERSFTPLPTCNRVTEILKQPQHEHLWSELDTIVRDEFPSIFARLQLYERLRREKQMYD